MAANYLMAQMPQYPYSLLWPLQTNIPGDFSLDDDSDKKTTGSPEPKSRNDMLTDAILFDRLNEDRTRPALGPDGMPTQNPMMGAADPMLSPYANPYYAQQQGQQQQQMNLKQAKQAWDMYRNY